MGRSYSTGYCRLYRTSSPQPFSTPSLWVTFRGCQIRANSLEQSPSGVGTTGLQLQGLGLINVAGAISENCACSKSCHSLSLQGLVTFVDSLAKNVSTPCFDLLAEIAGDGLSKDQLFANLAYGLIFLHNNPVPARLFTNTSINPLDFHAQILEWYRGNHSQPGLITLDNRVLLWVCET